jgi:hypothetical protein
MTKQMNLVLAATLMFGAATMQAQQAPATQSQAAAIDGGDGGGQQTATPKKKTPAKPAVKKPEPESELLREVRELREKQAEQQAEIDALKRANADKDAALQQANSSAQQAQSTAQAATAQAQSVSATVQANTDAVQALKSNVSDLQTTNAGLAATISANKLEVNDKIDSPSSLHYKGVTITPGGFVAFEGVFRNRSVNSDINTPLNSIPFPDANEGHVSELNFSGRQSRISALFEAPTGNVKLTGYYEADWLGTGTSSNNNQSNSYVMRQRQIWGQAAVKSGFTITGGQMWSLVTEDRKGLDPRTEIQPQTIDSQYLVGYSWERQPELRLEQHFGDYKTGAFTVGVSVEQAQITSFTANGTNPADYFFAGTGQNGGLYNAAAAVAAGNGASTSGITTYANNVAPDFVVKFAYDNPSIHAEIGGLARFLRDYYYPVAGTVNGGYTGTAAAPTYTYSSTYVSHTSDAGGVFGSVRGYLGKFAEVAVQGMAGTGVGRYGSSQLADATLRPDETLEPIKNYHGLFSLETHINPKFDVFAYYGGEYAQRTVYQTPEGNYIGYGPANLSDAGCYNLPTFSGTAGTAGSIGNSGACNSPTKYIEEGMFGFQWKPIVSPKYGRLQYSATYSIINRQLWAGVGSATTPVSPRAQDSMVHVQMRYYIP